MPPSATERESSVPLMWISAAFIGGVLLQIDRVPLWATAAAFTCTLWRLAAAMRSVPLPTRVVRAVAALALLGGVLAVFHTLNGLSAGTALLTAMGAVKLLETRGRRDQYIMIATAVFLLLAASLDRQGLARAPLYLLEMGVCVTALAIAADGGGPLNQRAAALLAVRGLVLALPLALVLFLFFPRIAGGFWALPSEETAQTGLGDTMSPGSISQLTESDEPAFRVHFHSRPPPPEERYWRGPVLHRFDGYTWRQASGFYRQQRLQYLGEPVRYTITLESDSNRWWYALDTITASPDPKVFFTYDYTLLASEPVTHPITYAAESYTHTRSIEPLSPLVRRLDTTLPAQRNPRTQALARELRERADSDRAFVHAVLERFRTGGFEYSLTPPRLDLDSVDDFLFNTHIGFCGHYASAFVALMRAGGVPARVITGYLGGEWNPLGGYFLIRQSDAHAWAEVWLEEGGWTRIDPTAVVAPERLRRGVLDLLPDALSARARLVHASAWLTGALQGWDALNTWWNERVVNYDFTMQLKLLDRFGIRSPDSQTLGWALAGGLICWLAWITWQTGMSPVSPRPDRLARAYGRLCRKLARAGLLRAAHEGPMGYAAKIATLRPDLAQPARALLMRYAELRYGAVSAAVSMPKIIDFERTVAAWRIRPWQPLPQQWRVLLKKGLPLYRRMPRELRLALEPLVHAFLADVEFVGCNGLIVTQEMRLTIAIQACLLIVARGDRDPYAPLHGVLIYPDEFIVHEVEEDEAGVVTEGERVLAGQTFDTSRIVLSWRDVQEGSLKEEPYNVVLHEFAHYLDHCADGQLTTAPAPRHGTTGWHTVLEREYAALCASLERGEEPLIDPYGAEHPAEFFAVATETFFEQPQELEQRHAGLYAQLREFYGLDPARWRNEDPTARAVASASKA